MPPGIKDLAPIEAAIMGAARGGFWVLQLSNFQDDQTHGRQIQAYCYNADGPPPNVGNLAPSYLPRVTITLALISVLLPLTKVFGPVRGH